MDVLVKKRLSDRVTRRRAAEFLATSVAEVDVRQGEKGGGEEEESGQRKG